MAALHSHMEEISSIFELLNFSTEAFQTWILLVISGASEVGAISLSSLRPLRDDVAQFGQWIKV